MFYLKRKNMLYKLLIKVQDMKVKNWMAFAMGRADSFIKMEVYMMVGGKITKWMDKENYSINLEK